MGFLQAMLPSAYIDPATTTYIIQIVVGAVVAVGAVVGIFWSKIKRLFKKSKPEEQQLATERAFSAESKKEINAADLADDEDDAAKKA
ncbi:MAG: hypothetical protein IK130_01320 [Oscillospiraceae bacterium]|nr:hypothetical protein [Oscillospiraceae bacterium]